MDLFEERLIEELQSKMISYNLQDLICKKCKNIKQNNLNKNCSCAGSLYWYRYRFLVNIAYCSTLT